MHEDSRRETGSPMHLVPVMDERVETAQVETCGRSRMPGTLPRLLLTVPDAGRALAVGRSTVYELIAAGELETVHIGRACRVTVESIESYVERLRGRMNST